MAKSKSQKLPRLVRLTRAMTGYKVAVALSKKTGLVIRNRERGGFATLKRARLVKLRIPRGAWVVLGKGKCRASKAEVLEITPKGPCASWHSYIHESSSSPWYHYQEGETMKPRAAFDRRTWKECASGIHFYRTPKEAREFARERF